MMDYENKDGDMRSFSQVVEEESGELLKWLKSCKDILIEEGQERTEQQRRFLHAYMGQDTSNRANFRGVEGERRRKRRIKKFRIPIIADIIDTKVSQMMRLKADIEVLPSHDEYSDRGAAKVAKAMVKYLFEQQELDAKMRTMHLHRQLFGESFLFITYDENIGDLDPNYVKARDAGIKEVNGVPLKPVKMGDVKYEVELPWRVLTQLKDKFEDCEYYIRYHVKATDDLVSQYPDKEEELTKASSNVEGLTVFNIELGAPEYVENHTVVYELVHRKTESVPNGSRILFTDDCILERTEYPYSMDGFNFVRITDLDLPGDPRGVSNLERTLPIQRLYDDLTTLIGKNIYMTAHAKIAAPQGSIKIDSLGNDNTILQYQGPIAPQMMQVQPNSPEVYSFRENLKNELQLLMGSHGISRGEIPKGITASSALQFLNELESERSSTDIAKHAESIKKIARITMSVAADYYDIDEERMVRIVGKDKKPYLKHFDAAVFSRPYDIRFESSSGFPETRAAKNQRIMETMQYNPTLFSPERWQYLLDLSDTEKMVSAATAAIHNAESEVEDILNGEQVAPPEPFEDHIQKLRVFYSALQSRSFKEDSDNETYEYFLAHVRDQEKMALEKAKTSPLFSAELANLKLFPVSPELGPAAQAVVQSMGQRSAEVEGQANRGDQITTQIPGQDEEGQ